MEKRWVARGFATIWNNDAIPTAIDDILRNQYSVVYYCAWPTAREISMMLRQGQRTRKNVERTLKACGQTIIQITKGMVGK